MRNNICSKYYFNWTLEFLHNGGDWYGFKLG